MAAIGGDTIVPTNWGGLLITAVIIAAIAAATYFGLESQLGGEAPPVEKDGVSVQEVFSANSQREVAEAKPARALPRAAFATASPRPAATPAPATPGPTVRPTAAPTSRPSPEPTARPTTAPTAPPQTATTPRPTVKPSTPSSTSSTAVATPAPARPSAEALSAWWRGASGSLGVRFAGPLDQGGDRSEAVAIMFSEPVSPATARQSIRLTNAAGQPVTAAWQSGQNPALLFIDGLAAGRYTLTLPAGLTGENGGRLSRALSGPVFVY